MEEMMCGERRRTRSNMLKFEIRWTGAGNVLKLTQIEEGLLDNRKPKGESWSVSKKRIFKKSGKNLKAN